MVKIWNQYQSTHMWHILCPQNYVPNLKIEQKGCFKASPVKMIENEYILYVIRNIIRHLQIECVQFELQPSAPNFSFSLSIYKKSSLHAVSVAPAPMPECLHALTVNKLYAESLLMNWLASTFDRIKCDLNKFGKIHMRRITPRSNLYQMFFEALKEFEYI